VSLENEIEAAVRAALDPAWPAPQVLRVELDGLRCRVDVHLAEALAAPVRRALHRAVNTTVTALGLEPETRVWDFNRPPTDDDDDGDERAIVHEVAPALFALGRGDVWPLAEFLRVEPLFPIARHSTRVTLKPPPTMPCWVVSGPVGPDTLVWRVGIDGVPMRGWLSGHMLGVELEPDVATAFACASDEADCRRGDMRCWTEGTAESIRAEVHRLPELAVFGFGGHAIELTPLQARVSAIGDRLAIYRGDEFEVDRALWDLRAELAAIAPEQHDVDRDRGPGVDRMCALGVRYDDDLEITISATVRQGLLHVENVVLNLCGTSLTYDVTEIVMRVVHALGITRPDWLELDSRP
jgi:hypothetical protein